jgi:hypothetical protein
MQFKPTVNIDILIFFSQKVPKEICKVSIIEPGTKGKDRSHQTATKSQRKYLSWSSNSTTWKLLDESKERAFKSGLPAFQKLN